MNSHYLPIAWRTYGLIRFALSTKWGLFEVHSSLHYAIRAMGAMSLRQKKDELESKNSHKSDILPPEAFKNEVIYLKIYFSDSRSNFSI